MPERRSDPATQVCPVTGAGRRGLLLFQPSAPRGSSPRPPVRLAPNGGSLCVLEAGTWPFLRILAIYSPILSASLRLVKNFYCQFSSPGAYWPWRRGRTGCGHGRMPFGKWNPPAALRHPPLTRGLSGGSGTRPYENTGSCPANAVGAGSRPARPGTKCGSGRAGEDTRPYENTGSCPVNAVGAGPRPARPGTKCGSGRAGEDTRPYEDTGSCPVNAVGAGPRPARRSRIMFGARRRGQAPALQKTDAQKSGRKPFKTGGPVCRPYGGERTGSVGSATPGAGAGPQQRKFLQGQGPVARREFETPLRFCAPGLFCLTQGVTLVMGVRG